MSGTRATICCDTDGGGGAIEVGCGLVGDGTAVAPLAVAPAAGEEIWPWPCDAADESTLRCDPATGQLWTPPENFAEVFANEATSPIPGNPYTPTGGLQITFHCQQIMVRADTCRPTDFGVTWHAAFDVAFTANATFRIGLAYTLDGGPVSFEACGGILTARGTPGHELFTGSVSRDIAGKPPGSANQIVQACSAIEVFAGSVTINTVRRQTYRMFTTTEP